jgi:O-antigen/teichoic acid export membrane protein
MKRSRRLERACIKILYLKNEFASGSELLSTDIDMVARDSARGGFFLVSGSILATVIQAIGVFLVARLLGPELYGVYTLSLVVPTLLLQVIDFGVNQGLLRFSVRLRVEGKTRQIASLVRNAFSFKLIVGLIISCFTILFSDYFATYAVNRPDLSMYIRLASLTVLFHAILDTSTSVFIGMDNAEYCTLVWNVQASAKTALSILLVFLGFGVLGAVTGFVVGALTAGILGTALLYSKIYKSLNSSIETGNSFKKSLKFLIGYSYPIYISALFFSIIPQLQSVILSMFASDADIGNFRAASNFVALISILILPISTVLFPAFSKFDKESEEIRKFFSLSTMYATLLIVPAVTITAIFSKEFVDVIYGSQWTLAPAFLSLNVLLYLFVGLGYQIQTSFFNGIEETFTTLKIGLTTFLLFILLSPFLTMYFSVQGMILATLVSSLLATIYGTYIAKTKFKVKLYYKKLLLIYSAAAFSAVPSLLIQKVIHTSSILEIIIAGLVYMLSYITLLPLLHVMTKQEIKNVEQIAERIPLVKPLIMILMRYQYEIAARLEQKPKDTT